MPIYEYQCDKCGEVFEVMQKLSDPSPKSHSCGSRKVRRVMSQTSFVLKGDGWYVTDYSRKGKKGSKSEGAGDSSAAPASSGDNKKSSKSSEAAA